MTYDVRPINTPHDSAETRDNGIWGGGGEERRVRRGVRDHDGRNRLTPKGRIHGVISSIRMAYTCENKIKTKIVIPLIHVLGMFSSLFFSPSSSVSMIATTPGTTSIETNSYGIRTNKNRGFPLMVLKPTPSLVCIFLVAKTGPSS